VRERGKPTAAEGVSSIFVCPRRTPPSLLQGTREGNGPFCRESLPYPHLSRNNKTLLNDTPVESTSPVKVGDRIRLGFTGPAIEILAIQPASQDGRISADFSSTVQADSRHLALLRGTGRTERFAPGAGGVIGRDAAVVQYHLDHPHISRLHASLVVDGKRSSSPI
jgi:hypothetical protein